MTLISIGSDIAVFSLAGLKPAHRNVFTINLGTYVFKYLIELTFLAHLVEPCASTSELLVHTPYGKS